MHLNPKYFQAFCISRSLYEYDVTMGIALLHSSIYAIRILISISRYHYIAQNWTKSLTKKIFGTMFATNRIKYWIFCDWWIFGLTYVCQFTCIPLSKVFTLPSHSALVNIFSLLFGAITKLTFHDRQTSNTLKPV